MRYHHSARLRDDIASSAEAACDKAGTVNIAWVAERVRVRNPAENVALEDVEHLVLQAAQRLGAAIEFDALNSGMAAAADDVPGPGYDQAGDGGLDSGRPASLQ